MLTRWLAIGILAATLLAGSAHADIMHWYWEVEVNGQAVDATQPIVVGAGDQVDIELWADWKPHRWGFAAGYFSISTQDAFFEAAEFVNIDEDDGFGRNPSFADLQTENGTFMDSDTSGQMDVIDAIGVSQLPFFINDTYDSGNPLPFYRIRWSLASDLSKQVSLIRSPTVVHGYLVDQVFADKWGTYLDYTPDDERLIFVPEPPVVIILCLLLATQPRRILTCNLTVAT